MRRVHVRSRFGMVTISITSIIRASPCMYTPCSRDYISNVQREFILIHSFTSLCRSSWFKCARKRVRYPYRDELRKIMREILHLQAGQCGNQIGSKVPPTFSAQICNLVRTYTFIAFKFFIVLGNNIGRARYRQRRVLSRRPSSATRKNRCLLQRGLKYGKFVPL